MMILATVQADTDMLNDWSAMNLDRMEKCRVLVVGMARSGLAAATLLADRHARVFVSEIRDTGAVTAAASVLRDRGIPFETGRHSVNALDHIDFIVTSPGVPPDNILLRTAQDRGIPVFSELEVASWVSAAPILAVTGSNGKTTTTAWLGEIYRQSGRHAEVGGNIGRAFAEFAPALTSKQRAILEVSTFQLERIEEFCPRVAALLNLSPDHLDRHGSFDEYVRLKFRLFENQTTADAAVLNADDPTIVSWDREHSCGKGRRWWFSGVRPVSPGVWLDGAHMAYDNGKTRGVIPRSDRLIPPGRHNRMNAAAAVAMALADGLSSEEITPGLTAFTGVEHRLETVTTADGVTFVNDSKATNPDAVAKAVQAFDQPLVVIMGGLDKGTDFTFLADLMRERVKALVLTGRAAPKLEVELGCVLPYRSVPRFDDAVEAAVDMAEPGDVVLLSPGCASFDQFENYEQRGQVFKRLVRKLIEWREGC